MGERSRPTTSKDSRHRLAPLLGFRSRPTICPIPCFGLRPNPNVILYPGPCGPLDLDRPPPRSVPYGPIFKASAKIGAFATDFGHGVSPLE